MKTVSKILMASTLSAGLMTPGHAMIESNEAPDRFSVLASFMEEFDDCWQKDMQEFHRSFVGMKQLAKSKSDGIDYAKFTIQEVGKNDKAVYGVRITLPGVDPRSIKISLRNDNGNKKLSLTASLTVAKPTETATPAEEHVDTTAKSTVETEKTATTEPVKQSAAQAPAKKGKAERAYTSQQMYTYKMVNGRTREMTIQDGQITVMMDLPAVDISAFEKSFKDGVIAIDFTKEADVEERTISFDGESNENVADEQPSK
jgi:HSP20 family molecular chaperone IbpA